MKDFIKISSLLQETAPKIRAYQAQRKEKRRMGYDFNIFSVMGMERNEVKTHSAMIAELLNPNGSHGQGDIFLRNFLENIAKCKVLSNDGKEKETLDKWKLRNPIANESVIIMKEKSYPNVKDFGTDNRIDIVVEFDNLIMLIENKIDAADQPKQLKRYSDVGKDLGKDYCLLYLTKKGTPASATSLGGKGIEYEQISYQKDIISWLNLCLREEKVIHRTSLQKAILQYRDTVVKITGMNMNSKFNNEMIELLMIDENLKCAEEISKFLPKVKGKMLDDFFENTVEKLEKAGFLIADTKNISKDLLWHDGKGKEWFYGNINKQRAKNFGLFFDIGEKNVLFYVMIATTALHYGFVGTNPNNS